MRGRHAAEGVDAHVQRQQDVVLRLEVVIESRLGDAQLLGDLAQAGAVEALLYEEVEGRIEDALAGVWGGVASATESTPGPGSATLPRRASPSGSACAAVWDILSTLLDGR